MHILAMIGTGELLVILGLVLVLFGGKKLPELARNLGQGLREFKRSCSGLDEADCGEKTHCCKRNDHKDEPKND